MSERTLAAPMQRGRAMLMGDDELELVRMVIVDSGKKTTRRPNSRSSSKKDAAAPMWPCGGTEELKLERLFQTETRAAAKRRRGKWWASHHPGHRRFVGISLSDGSVPDLTAWAWRCSSTRSFVGRERFIRVQTNASLPSFASLFFLRKEKKNFFVE